MAPRPTFRVLVFSKTAGYRHDSIPAAISALKALTSSIFDVDASEDEGDITPSSLQKYAVVVLLQCTGDFLSEEHLNALKEFVRNGGGIVGIHAAAVGMPNNDWYGALLGSHFDSHPEPEVGTVLVEDDSHYITKIFGRRSAWMDEWYNFRSHPRQNGQLKVLLKGDTSSFKGGKMGDDHPLEWCQEFEGGRSYYTALGHFDEAYGDSWFMERVFRGILWAARYDVKPDTAQ